MSLTTHSKFYFGYEISDEALYIDFDEGGAELTAELDIGNYTLTDFADELARALNEAGALTYSVDVNRSTRVLTISATGNFTLRITSGSHLGTTAFGVAGFTGADVTGDNEYIGNAGAGSEYVTQFILQSYVSPEDFQEAIYGTVNQSASGAVEVVTFGELRFIEANLKYVTNVSHGATGVIRSDSSGVAKLRTFMQYLTTKAPLEFMPDEDTPATYYSVMLEGTPDDSKGLKYKLKELYSQGLPGYFETGNLKFRVLE
jgi:hypothetical protein